MSSMLNRVALVATMALTAGLGVSTSADAVAPVFDCAGMFAPTKPGDNVAPVLVDDTASVLAGDSVSIPVLANDSDSNVDDLYVVGATQGGTGFTCVNSDGTVQYFAQPGTPTGTDTFSYAVSDGDSYRTAMVTVSVEGVNALTPTLTSKLVVKRGKVKRAAKVGFSNSNTRTVQIVAGNFRKAPIVNRTVAAGGTLAFSTRLKRLDFVVFVENDAHDFVYVDDGTLNTKTGKVTLHNNAGRQARLSYRTWGR
ncbi:MAG: Ig-like domain-containing protein [Marmoricola sp.]